jgi:hypothetical protein
MKSIALLVYTVIGFGLLNDAALGQTSANPKPITNKPVSQATPLRKGIDKQADQCQAWFEALWKSTDPVTAQTNTSQLPTRCEANPWVAWLTRKNNRDNQWLMNDNPSWNESFFRDVEQLQQAVQLSENGRFKESTDLLHQLRNRRSYWPEIHYNLGINQLAIGDVAAAKPLLSHANELCAITACNLPRKALQDYLSTTYALTEGKQ